MLIFTEEELIALGLTREGIVDEDAIAVFEIDSVVVPLDTTSALGNAASAMEYDDLLERGHPTAFASLGGFEFAAFDEQRSVWRILPPDGGAVARAQGDSEGIREDLDGKVIYVDFTRTGPVAFRRKSGSVAVVAKYEDGVAKLERFGLFLQEPGPESLKMRLWSGDFPEVQSADAVGAELKPTLREPELANWIAELDDPWLRNELRMKYALETPWQHFVAVGMLLRLRRVSGAPAVELAGRLLSGTNVRQREREREWARAQSRSVLRSMERLTLGAIESISKKLEELAVDWDAGEPVTAREVAEVLHLRDDVASAHVLLAAAGVSRLRPTLERLDERGGDLVRKWSEDIDLRHDERLHRAVVSDPHGWWTALSAEHD